jgi:hypothetical protein
VRCALCGPGYVIVLLVTGLMNLRIMGSTAATIVARRLARKPAPLVRKASS